MPAAPTYSRNVLAATVGIVALSFATSATAERDRNRVQSVRHVQAGSNTSVIVKGTKTATFSVYKLERPARVVVDLANATIDSRLEGASGGKSVFDVNSWAVSQVSAHQVVGSSRSLVRIVVGLARPGGYQVKAVGNDLRIEVAPRAAMPVSAASGDTAAAQADAKKARDALRVAQKASHAARLDADRRVAMAMAEAKRIKSVLAAARAEATRARASLKLAQQDADQAKRDAAQSKQQAKAATDRARRAVADAQDEAAKAKLASVQRLKAAQQQLAVASSKLARAQVIINKAEADKLAAQKARVAAAADAARAKARLSAATAAELRANSQNADAARAAKRAADLQRQAAQLASANSHRAADLRKQADAATADAQRRKAVAEAALKAAEARRLRAVAAAKTAESRRLRAVAAVKAAEDKRDLANQQRQVATAGKVQAESQWQAAEDRRKRAQAAADEASRRAKRASMLLKQEQDALAQTRRARAAAVTRNRAASRANARLVASVDDVTKAKTLADQHRAAAATAAKQLQVLARDRAATQKAISDARAKTVQLAKRAADAEARLADRVKLVAQRRVEVQRLATQRDAATAELRRLRADAAKARTARLAEEAKLTALAKQRVQAEAQLRRMRSAQKAPVAKVIKPLVRDIDFVDKRDTARVVIALSSPAKPRVIQSRGRRLVLEIPDVEIGAKLERTLDTTKFRGPVRAVSSFRDPKDANNVRVVVDLAHSAKGELVRVGNTYYWDFRKSAAAAGPTVAAKPSPRRSATRSASYRAPVVGGYGAVSTPITQHTVAQLNNKGRRVYRGRKIDLDFKDADIHNLLRLLADVGAVNVVVPDSIKAKVTVRLKRVPWDQALEVILSSKGLWYRRVGNLYRVAPRKELDAEDEAEAKRLKLLAGSEAPEPEVFTLNYADADAAKKQLTPLLSPKGKIEIDKRTNALIINDIRAHRRRLIALVRRLDTQTPQIQIEARIVEARSTYIRQVGVQWGGSATASQATGNATGLIFPNSVGVFGAATQGQQTASSGANPLPSDFAVSLPASVGTGTGGALGFTLGSVGGNFSLSLRLSALEDQGTVRIISSPKITVINNETAEIKQGTSVPISVPAANGTGTQTTFVPADLSLKVTPQVSQRDCSITMKLEIKNNEIGPVTAQGESILTKEAKTTLLIADSQTTVVGGVYTRNTGLTYSKVPFFGDLPVVGWFFKSRRESDERAELLIFITPRITNKAFLRCE